MTVVDPAPRPVLWLGREPAQWLQLTSAFLIFLSPLAGFSAEVQGVIIAVLTSAFGLATAAAVAAEKAAPLVAGLIKALIALALAFRFEITPEAQAGLMVFVEAGVAFYLRTQVVVTPVGPAPVEPAPAPAPHIN